MLNEPRRRVGALGAGAALGDVRYLEKRKCGSLMLRRRVRGLARPWVRALGLVRAPPKVQVQVQVQDASAAGAEA